MKGYEYLLRFLNNEGFRKNDEGNYFGAGGFFRG